MLIQQGTQAAILEMFTLSTSNLFILFIGTTNMYLRRIVLIKLLTGPCTVSLKSSEYNH